MDKCSNAFSKYVDAVFVYQNNLFRYVKRTQAIIPEMCLETKSDEMLLLTGICSILINNINSYLKFQNTKNSFNATMLKICKDDLSYSEYKSKKEEAEKKLFNHAKFQYCIDNYFADYQFGNKTYMAGLLISIYANICNKLKSLSLDRKIPTIRNTNFYNYIKEANLELGINISNFAKLNLSQLIERIFNHLVACDYEEQYSIIEPMLMISSSEDQSNLGYEEAYLDIAILDDENPSQNEFKKSIEQNVRDWLSTEMRTLPNGRIFQ